jgi:hypothetical protein
MRSSGFQNYPYFRCQSEARYPGDPHTLVRQLQIWDFPQSPIRFSNSLELSPESTLLIIIVYYKAYKWTPKVKWYIEYITLQKGTEYRIVWPYGIGVVHLLGTSICSQTKKLLDPCFLGIFSWFHKIQHNWWNNQLLMIALNFQPFLSPEFGK